VNHLAKLQNALATIVTDGEVEDVYRRTPGEAIVAVADRETHDELGGLEPADILRYARGLRGRRWNEVATAVPLSMRVIAGLEARYDAWLSTHPALARDTVVPRGADEALRAVVDLAHDLFNDPSEAPWAAELLVYEVLAACSRADGVARGLKAQYPIHTIMDELRDGMVPADRPAEPHAYAFGIHGVQMKRLE
jgi:hypothetical protein